MRNAEKIARLLLAAEYTVVLTGAGISTASGIPDFRSPGKGLWEKVNPSLFSAWGFQKDPVGFYKIGMQIFDTVSKAKPNQAHIAVAKLESLGLIKAVVTQNIDGLHQAAGSKKVLEIHGNIRGGHCIRCGIPFSMEDIIRKLQKELPPKCKCGGIIKPDVVLFGDPLPQNTYNEVLKHIKKADLLLVLGSSLVVSPANLFPKMVLDHGGDLVIVNLERTHYDLVAAAVVRSRLEKFMPKVLKAVESLLGHA